MQPNISEIAFLSSMSGWSANRTQPTRPIVGYSRVEIGRREIPGHHAYGERKEPQQPTILFGNRHIAAGTAVRGDALHSWTERSGETNRRLRYRSSPPSASASHCESRAVQDQSSQPSSPSDRRLTLTTDNHTIRPSARPPIFRSHPFALQHASAIAKARSSCAPARQPPHPPPSTQ